MNLKLEEDFMFRFVINDKLYLKLFNKNAVQPPNNGEKVCLTPSFLEFQI